MSLVQEMEFGKGDAEIGALAGDLRKMIVEAAAAGLPLDQVERSIWTHLRKIGHAGIGLFID